MKLKPSIVFAFMVAICATPLSAVSSDGGSLDQARSEPPVQTANGVGDSGPSPGTGGNTKSDGNDNTTPGAASTAGSAIPPNSADCALFNRLDTNNNGGIERSEANQSARALEVFDVMDVNGRGIVTREQWNVYFHCR